MKLASRVSINWLAALALFIGAFVLYARTMAPGLLDGDEGEFQTNIYRLGVSHTGYPLFFLLGKLWTLLIPLGTMATRANLFAVLWGAVTVVAIFSLPSIPHRQSLGRVGVRAVIDGLARRVVAIDYSTTVHAQFVVRCAGRVCVFLVAHRQNRSDDSVLCARTLADESSHDDLVCASYRDFCFVA